MIRFSFRGLRADLSMYSNFIHEHAMKVHSHLFGKK